MYSHVGRFSAADGRESDLLEALVSAARSMPGTKGLIQYQIFAGEDGAVWAVEIWESREAHDAALQLPETRSLIDQVRPIIASGQSNHLTYHGGVTNRAWTDPA
jgi:quinol monooxygenase YgiN